MNKEKKLKFIDIATIVFNSVIVSCTIGLPFFLYNINDFPTFINVIDLFSIEWTIFGVFVAITAIIAILLKGIKVWNKEHRSLFVELIAIVADSFVSCIFLVITSISIFMLDEKLFASLIYANMFFLPFCFINFMHLFISLLIKKLSLD